MRYETEGKAPRIHESATVAPTAVISGDVGVGPHAHISFGAVILGDDGPVTIGEQSVIRENVVIRASKLHPVSVGDYVLIGARSALYGCTIGDEVFLATGVTIFHGARVGRRAEVRINGIVHVNTSLPPETTVPIGWIAVGDPATVLPPGEHERIWAIQEPLNFPRAAYGLERGPDGGVDMKAVTERAKGSSGRRVWRECPLDSGDT
jgi:carbonic anhydrase/acetyltransferase-like protein (isoleucine patch superfamily)